MRRLLLLTFALCALTGCIGHTATPSVQGTAYVITNTPFSGTMYYCDARGERPQCWAVEELDVEATR